MLPGSHVTPINRILPDTFHSPRQLADAFSEFTSAASLLGVRRRCEHNRIHESVWRRRYVCHFLNSTSSEQVNMLTQGYSKDVRWVCMPSPLSLTAPTPRLQGSQVAYRFLKSAGRGAYKPILNLALAGAISIILASSAVGQNVASLPCIDSPALGSASESSASCFAEPPEAYSEPPSPLIVRSTVQVKADDQKNSASQDTTKSYHATASEIEASAGTYGDFSRYLQLFPGVVFNSDVSDDVLVRGGNPIENLYLLDGIEIPNINHIATGATTGGLVSMIDTAAIDNIDFETGGYNASYEERLSSVININSRELTDRNPFTQVDAGFVGAGLIREVPLGNDGSLLVSVHRSLLNLFTDDIGLNGVPIYTNSLARAQRNLTDSDTITMDSLAGIDSIDIRPEALDDDETNTINTQYHGWRMTNGIRWRHMYSSSAFGTTTVSDSEQEQNIQQQDQLFDDELAKGYTPSTMPTTPVYSELTHQGVTNARYDGYVEWGKYFTLILGASAHLNRIDYNVAQPRGEQSPLNSDPARSDATSFSPHFSTGDSGSYAQGTFSFHRWTLSGGGRVQTFAFGGRVTATPRLSTAFALSRHTALHASFGRYNQLPPFLDMLSFPQNRWLTPIGVRQVVAGVDLYKWNKGSIGIEAYQKDYSGYPVSTEYPSLSLANMVDTLGQEFIWIPLTSAGNGLTRGVELSSQMRLGANVFLQANLAYARSLFSSLDGIMRPGNFDYPLVLNAAGSYRFARRYQASGRYEYTSGRPYTPFELQESEQQNRPIYNLNLINADRGPYYSRLDFQVSRTFLAGPRHLVVYGGLENAFNRVNFLGYAWMPRAVSACEWTPARCVSTQNQMGRFPNFGAKYVF
jgi:hypothetical protein